MQISGLSQVIDQADAFILDLWGVIHDGVEPYANARDTLKALRNAGKRTCLLSNAPRRAAALVAQLAGMGIERALYDEVMSSGEAVWMELKDRNDPFFAALGRNLYHMGPERDRNVFEGLDLEPVPVESADFILNTGPWSFEETVEDYMPVMVKALERNLPMVCANPDFVVIRQGQEVVCAGALAARYGEMGGRVAMRGKPDAAIYGQVFKLLGVAKDRVMAVGDALHTDIAGANAAGIKSCFVTQGIHASELGIKAGQVADKQALERAYDTHHQRPSFAIPSFVW